MSFFLLITGVLISVSTAESVSWSFVVLHHSKWLKDHPDYERRMAVSPVILAKVAIFSFGLSVISWSWFMHLTALFLLGSFTITYKVVTCFILVLGIQIITILLWSIVSTFICLPGIYWPWISKVRFKVGLSMFSPTMTESYI